MSSHLYSDKISVIFSKDVTSIDIEEFKFRGKLLIPLNSLQHIHFGSLKILAFQGTEFETVESFQNLDIPNI